MVDPRRASSDLCIRRSVDSSVMRILVLGGTGFVGGSIVRELVSNGHEVLVVHRGTTEPIGGPDVPHLHRSRDELAAAWPEIGRHSPDALIDVAPYSRHDARAVLRAAPDDLRLLALSSMDVYRASTVLRGARVNEPVPLDEHAKLREERFIYREATAPDDDYEKIDVEEEYLAREATVLRLPMVYGEGDPQRREEFILSRCRAGRDRIPIGSGSLVWSRGYVRDIARAARLALEHSEAAGEVFNVCEARTWSIRGWSDRIANAAGWDGEFVTVSENVLPTDMRLTRSFDQQLLFDASRARTMLGWQDSDRGDALRASVAWHLAHPPERELDFSEDDVALGNV